MVRSAAAPRVSNHQARWVPDGGSIQLENALVLLCHLSGLPCIRCAERVAAGTSWQAFNDGVDEPTAHRCD